MCTGTGWYRAIGSYKRKCLTRTYGKKHAVTLKAAYHAWLKIRHERELSTDKWELLDGYSGQDRYSGPIMHASEYVGGRMERDILATPGVYVALVDYCLDDSDPEGWAVARMIG